MNSEYLSIYEKFTKSIDKMYEKFIFEPIDLDRLDSFRKELIKIYSDAGFNVKDIDIRLDCNNLTNVIACPIFNSREDYERYERLINSANGI